VNLEKEGEREMGRTSTVVLGDLVFGVLGATADDVGLAGSLLDGDTILAHIYLDRFGIGQRRWGFENTYPRTKRGY
jgi:hypothetical protein